MDYVELHDMYINVGGKLGRKQMFNNLANYMSSDVHVVRLDGFASITGFREVVGKSLNVVKLESDDDDSVDTVVREIRIEARALKYQSGNYDLGEFTHVNILKQTSSTLLKLISMLVSNGTVIKQSLSLSQSIQAHITSTRNQTTLGLAVKLHHRHGSELIKLLHDHGFVVSYDEVLRFKKIAAAFVSSNADLLNRFMGLSKRVGVIFGWFDNLDIQVCTPNGRRNTHAMAHEFQQPHSAGILEAGLAHPGTSNLVIPRLTKTLSASNRPSQSLHLEHYTGPKKVDPPAMSMTPFSYSDVCARQTSLYNALEKYVQ